MSIKHNIEKSQTNNKIATYYGQKKLLKFRAEVNQLYFTEGLSKNMITAKKHISKHFVIRWTQSPDQDFSIDNRGWPRGKRRKWDQHTEHRIVELHAYLKANPKAFFWGASAIEQEWRVRYPNETIPPLRTIGQILKDLGLSDKYRSNRNKGAARYQAQALPARPCPLEVKRKNLCRLLTGQGCGDGQDGSHYGIFGQMVSKAPAADFNNDGLVNFRDFCILAEEWRKNEDLLRTDLIDNNRIDERDLAAFCKNWLMP